MTLDDAIHLLKIVLSEAFKHPVKDIEVYTWPSAFEEGVRISEICLLTHTDKGLSVVSYMQSDPPHFAMLFAAERFLIACMNNPEHETAQQALIEVLMHKPQAMKPIQEKQKILRPVQTAASLPC